MKNKNPDFIQLIFIYSLFFSFISFVIFIFDMSALDSPKEVSMMIITPHTWQLLKNSEILGQLLKYLVEINNFMILSASFFMMNFKEWTRKVLVVSYFLTLVHLAQWILFDSSGGLLPFNYPIIIIGIWHIFIIYYLSQSKIRKLFH